MLAQGKAEFKVKEHFADRSVDMDIACYGFAVPLWSSCKGLITSHGSYKDSEVCTMDKCYCTVR